MKTIKELCQNKKSTLVMGILNITPDSFSDGGKFFDTKKALDRVKQMLDEGADIIDIGAQSTRPNFVDIGAKEETQRLLRVLDKIRSQYNDIVISVDTFRAEVVESIKDYNIDIINDIWGLKFSENMASSIAKSESSVIIMHNRQNKDSYTNFFENISQDINQSLTLAKQAGISLDKIAIDPGFGFAKTMEQNLLCLKNIDFFENFNCPILLGVSRKSTIGNVLNENEQNRLAGSLAIASYSILKGVNILRAHDVKETAQTVKMLNAILK